jgi:hypothetical protein
MTAGRCQAATTEWRDPQGRRPSHRITAAQRRPGFALVVAGFQQSQDLVLGEWFDLSFGEGWSGDLRHRTGYFESEVQPAKSAASETHKLRIVLRDRAAASPEKRHGL